MYASIYLIAHVFKDLFICRIMDIIGWLTVFLSLFYLRKVKTDLCDYLEEIGDIYCTHVDIKVLRSDQYPINLTNISDMRRMHLTSANVKTVEFDAFYGMNSLVYLNLSENKIKELDNRLFTSTPELRTLVLSRNQMASLGKDLLLPLTELVLLDVSGNPLLRLTDPQAFSSMKKLLYLRANYINIKSIPTDLLESLSSLREVELRDNEISCKCNMRNFSEWARQKCISLSLNCRGKNNVNHPSLEYYYEHRCGPNGKTRIRPWGGYYPRNRPDYGPGIYRDFSFRFPHNNKYPSHYPEDSIDLPEEDYTYDDTDTNESLPVTNFNSQCVTSCRYSTTLDLMDCQATGITSFCGLNYPFKERAFSQLILDNNKLESLQRDSFDGLSELISISLRKMGLRTLDSNVFQDLKKLKFLDLSDNVLHNLMDKGLFLSQTNLVVLYINNNGIRLIDNELLKPLKSLKRVSLLGNPIDCNCDIQVMVRAVIKQRVYAHAICRYPELYDKLSWNILENAPQCKYPQYYTPYKIETDQTTVVFIFFGSILAACCLVQFIYIVVNKYHKPKPGTIYYIPPDADIF